VTIDIYYDIAMDIYIWLAWVISFLFNTLNHTFGEREQHGSANAIGYKIVR